MPRTEPYKAKVAEKPDVSRVEALWRNFSEEELKLVEACIGDRLRTYGYPVLSFDYPHPVECIRSLPWVTTPRSRLSW